MLQVPTMAISFGRRLKEFRERTGLTQEQLARAAGLSTSFLSKLEQKDHDPSWSTVQALAKALGLTCDAFSQADEPPAGQAPAEKPAKGKARK